uniref:Reverse transcriptase domain-containing protein n=1 Tax=Leptobrachium leishanense TaxID=445787 RepID=A0A8C5PGR8_9ANUR
MLARILRPRHPATMIPVIRDEQGKVHRSPESIRDAFTAYFGNLYRHSPTHTLENTLLLDKIDAYLNRRALPSLSAEQIATLALPITEEEIKRTLGSKQLQKAPGPDGFTGQYYKTFMPNLSPFMCRLFNEARGGKSFPAESLLASMVLIPKPGKDPEGNYRPISLLNTDIKVLAKILALRLDPYLSLLISPDQVGFVMGRQAYENTRRAADFICLAHEQCIPSLFISLDEEKAFDRAEWPFLFTLLAHQGFPPSFIRLISALYDSPGAQILIPGTERVPFRVWNGTRQGCPLSLALFVLFLEPLLQTIRDDPGITGFGVGELQFKLSAYADDVLISLTNPQKSVLRVMERLQEVSEISGYRINVGKSEAIPVALPVSVLSDITASTPIQMAESEIKYLGIRLPTCPNKLYDANYPRLIKNIKKDLESWDKHNISWIGRVNCIKMNVLPRLLYIFQTLPIPLIITEFDMLQRAIDQFVWAGRRRRVARHTLYCSRALGRLGLPSLLSYYYATQLAQIVAWHSPRGSRRWVDLESGLMRPNALDQWLWIGREHRPLLCTACPAIKNSLRIWYKLAGKCNLTSFPSLLTPIFGNKEFVPGLTTMCFFGVLLYIMCFFGVLSLLYGLFRHAPSPPPTHFFVHMLYNQLPHPCDYFLMLVLGCEMIRCHFWI